MNLHENNDIMIVDEVPTPETSGTSTLPRDSSRTGTPNIQQTNATSNVIVFQRLFERWQEKILRENLMQGTILTKQHLEKLCQQTYLTEEQVKRWFASERKKLKKRQNSGNTQVTITTLPLPTVQPEGLVHSTSTYENIRNIVQQEHPETPYMEKDGNTFVIVGDDMHRIKKMFYVNKERLIGCSKYMQTLFFINAKENTSVPVQITNAAPELFEKFLSALDPNSEHVSDQTVEQLLSLADRFDAPILRWKCEGFLLSNTCRLQVLAKLKLADDYGLTNVTEAIIDRMSTLGHFHQLFKVADKRGFNHTALSDSIKARLYEKLSTLL
uniref:Homeobox domain-containing protein n=1 Tax=Acrobeloides nanus TaxID=290746 RepID=A0A914D450_9BILA